MKNYNKTPHQTAYDALNACASPDGFVAGAHHFVDLWARDSLFATLGANVVGMSRISEKTIETFLHFQRADGLVPFLIRRSKLTIGKYFGHPTYLTSPKAQFRSSQSGGIVPDGGLMTVIAAHALGDRKFFQKHERQLQQAIAWYERRFGDSLISEWFQCEWADAIMKRGNTLYTNVLYWKALGDIGDTEKQNWIGSCIQRELWNGEYFSDWKSVFRHDYFTSYANMLAVVWGLATPAEAQSILSYAKCYCWNTFTLETNYPKYPAWRIPIQNYLVGMADYHNRGCLWLQPGILYAVALKKSGRAKEARRVLKKISEKIVEYNGVHEVYEKDGSPARRFFYRAEEPFAWSAALYIWAHSICFSK